MILYNDAISSKDARHEISLTVLGKKLNNGKIDIYNNNELIKTDYLNGNSYNSAIEGITSKLTTLKIFITNGTNFQYIPLSTLRLYNDEPFIICDIDFTLSYTNFLLYLTRNLLSIKMLPDASTVLNKLSKRYTIIYLTGRFINHTKMTKLWLKKHDFPEGPIISRQNQSTFHLQSYKTQSITSVTAISKNGIGIGDLNSDIRAYNHHNLVAIKIKNPILKLNKNNRYKQKPDFFEADSWKVIDNLFEEKDFYR